jgi:hypothetical protein
MTDPDDIKTIEELQLFQTLCVNYLRDAAEIVEKLIA